MGLIKGVKSHPGPTNGKVGKGLPAIKASPPNAPALTIAINENNAARNMHFINASTTSARWTARPKTPNLRLRQPSCIAARMCNSKNCPVGVATQKPELRKRLDVQVGAERLARYFGASTELMQLMARACGHDPVSKFTASDLTTWKRDMADLSGVCFGGVL